MEFFDTEDMENLFGDHVQITVTKDGIEIEAYVHE